MRRPLAGLLLGLTWVGHATAQAPGPDAVPTPAAPPAAADTGGGSSSTTTVYRPLGLPAPGTDINAGLPSSSRPITGEQSDSFDLGSGTGSGVVFGAKGATGELGSDRPISVPNVHLVKKGDTLWGLSNQYLHNPWGWPTLWSYNPQVQNPNWIYPGDQLRMRHPNEIGAGGDAGATRRLGQGGFTNRRPAVSRDTVFLRDQGFLGDPTRDVWGELVGAVEEQMLLAEGNRVYLYMRPGVEVSPGQELTIFRDVRQPENVPGARKPPGRIVTVNGSVKVTSFDPKTRVARAEVSESIDAIERGAKVGPVRRKFDVVPPSANTKAVESRVLTSVFPHVYLGQNQVVFLDRGSDDGLAIGNTLHILRRGDTWRGTLAINPGMLRERVKMESSERVELESTPLHGDPETFPEESVAELRVLRVEKQSAIALVVQSRREVIPGDRAVSVVGR